MRSIYKRDAAYWFAIIPAIMIRDLDRKFRTSRMSGLLLVLEPIMLIAAIGAIQYFVRDGVPMYGPSMALFLITGFVPFYLFVNASRGLSKDVTNEREFPIVNDLDIQFARLFIEILRNLALFAVALAIVYMSGTTEAIPVTIGPIIGGLLTLTALALGLGLCTSALITVFPAYSFVNGLFSRAFFFGSGVFSILDNAPEHIREVTQWNPLGQCLIWVRLGFYPDFPHMILDRGYAVQVGIIVLTIGFAAFAARPVQTNG